VHARQRHPPLDHPTPQGHARRRTPDEENSATHASRRGVLSQERPPGRRRRQKSATLKGQRATMASRLPGRDSTCNINRPDEKPVPARQHRVGGWRGPQTSARRAKRSGRAPTVGVASAAPPSPTPSGAGWRPRAAATTQRDRHPGDRDSPRIKKDRWPGGTNQDPRLRVADCLGLLARRELPPEGGTRQSAGYGGDSLAGSPIHLNASLGQRLRGSAIQRPPVGARLREPARTKKTADAAVTSVPRLRSGKPVENCTHNYYC